MNDADILLEAYHRLGQRYRNRAKWIEPEKDKQMIQGIISRVSLMVTRLATPEIVLSLQDIRKYLIQAKGLYLQYEVVCGRNPGLISDSLHRNIERMLRGICAHEADMIGDLRSREVGGYRIDLRVFFEQKDNLTRLSAHVAKDILENVIGANDVLPSVYITETGKRYHRKDCPYCRGRILTAVAQNVIGYRRLSACKCLTKPENPSECGYVTAFIDESLHGVAWDRNGNEGAAGSFSYIISWGDLTDESQVKERMILSQGVECCKDDHVERIAEAAITKVLVTIAFDYHFSGRVKIFTDNKSVAERWKKTGSKSELAQFFTSVDVRFIPRERNRRADKLGRSRVILDLPVATYNQMVQEKKQIEELEERIRQLETQLMAEKHAVSEIPEAIVAKRVINPCFQLRVE